MTAHQRDLAVRERLPRRVAAGVEQQLAPDDPAAIQAADLAIVPGSKHTVGDLEWLRRQRLDAALTERVAAGRPVLAVCGGYQMLGTDIVDDVESRAGHVSGLGLLPVRTVCAADKVLAQRSGKAPRRTLLRRIAGVAGKDWRPGNASFAAVRARRHLSAPGDKA